MPFCAEGAKRHYKGLTIDGIFGVRYIRLELHVGAEIALNFENVVRPPSARISDWRRLDWRRLVYCRLQYYLYQYLIEFGDALTATTLDSTT